MWFCWVWLVGWVGLVFFLLLYKVALAPSALAEFNIFDLSVKQYNTGEDPGFRQTAQGFSLAQEAQLSLWAVCCVGLWLQQALSPRQAHCQGRQHCLTQAPLASLNSFRNKSPFTHLCKILLQLHRILRPCDSHVCPSPPGTFPITSNRLIHLLGVTAVSSALSNAYMNNHVTVVWTCSCHLFKAKSIPSWMEGGEGREGWRRTMFYHVFHGSKTVQSENIPASLHFALSWELEKNEGFDRRSKYFVSYITGSLVV